MKPDLDAIRARYLGEDTLAPPGAVLDVEVLLAHIDELERELAELKARIVVLEGMKT